MSEFTDGLRELADLIDGGKLSFNFIKKDLKHRIPMYVTEIKARAYLLKNHAWFDDIDLGNLNGKETLEDRRYGREKVRTHRAGPDREEPWWLRDFDRSRSERTRG